MKFHYKELRNIHQAINKLNLEEQVKKEKEELLVSALIRMIKLSKLARKEGLLGLEDAVRKLPENSSSDQFLKQLITLLVDGTYPSEISKIGLMRYYSSLVTDYEALIYFIYLEGTLMIQDGLNPRLLKERLWVMLPNDVFNTCNERLEEQLHIR